MFNWTKCKTEPSESYLSIFLVPNFKLETFSEINYLLLDVPRMIFLTDVRIRLSSYEYNWIVLNNSGNVLNFYI